MRRLSQAQAAGLSLDPQRAEAELGIIEKWNN